MAFSPIALTIPNYRDYKNYWIKAYVPSTTTPKVMATDKTGATTVAKFELNTDGFPKTSGGALVTPYIDDLYDLWLFPTESEADANDTTNALRLAINVSSGNTDGSVINFPTLNDAVISTNAAVMVDGRELNIKERTSGNEGGGVWDVVLLSTVTPNSYDIVQCTGAPTLALVMREMQYTGSPESVAELKSTDLTVGVLASTRGYRSAGGIGAASYLIKTTAQASSDGDVIDELGNHTMSNGHVAIIQIIDEVSVTQFGSYDRIGNDCALQTQAAIDYCIAKQIKLTGSGDFDYHSVVNFRKCRVDFLLANIAIHHATGPGVIIGGISIDPSNPYQSFKQFTRSVGVDGYHTPTVRIMGSRGQHIEIGFCPYLQMYADTNSTEGGTSYTISYSTFRVQNVDILELTTNNTTDGSLEQWINENKITMSSCRVLLINGTYQHNHNIFTGGTFESASAQIEMQVGRSNYVRDIRNEGILNVHFFTGVNDCAVILTMTNSGHQYDNPAATIVNNQGQMCTVQHEYDTLAPLQTIAAFDYQGLIKVATNYNVQGVSNVVISGTDLAALSFDYFYESKLIPATALSSFFELLMVDVPAGGVRIEVAGYDANKALIAPAPDQVNYAGAPNKQFSESDVTINTSVESKFYILDGNCRYVKIKVRAGGLGIAFDSLYLGVRVPEMQARKALIGCVNTNNNFV